jgi:hypothetical protein
LGGEEIFDQIVESLETTCCKYPGKVLDNRKKCQYKLSSQQRGQTVVFCQV